METHLVHISWESFRLYSDTQHLVAETMNPGSLLSCRRNKTYKQTRLLMIYRYLFPDPVLWLFEVFIRSGRLCLHLLVFLESTV